MFVRVGLRFSEMQITVQSTFRLRKVRFKTLEDILNVNQIEKSTAIKVENRLEVTE